MTPVKQTYTGRNRSHIIILAVVYCGLMLLYARWDASLWIIGFLMFATVPLVMDIIADRRGEFVFDDNGVQWSTQKSIIQITLAQIDSVTFKTRLDGSRKMTLMTTDGQKIVVPPHLTPPYPAITAALDAKGIKHRAHHFF